MHPHPCLKPEELAGIFPSLQGLKPTQIKASFRGVGQGSLPAQSHIWDVSPEHNNIGKSFQCLHPFLTPSQLSWWLKTRALAKLLGPSILPTGFSLEGLSWCSPAQQPGLVSRLSPKPRTAHPCWEPVQSALKILPAFISSGAASFPTLFPCAWKTRELPGSFLHLLPRGCFSCKGRRETLSHRAGWGVPAPGVLPVCQTLCLWGDVPMGISAASQN